MTRKWIVGIVALGVLGAVIALWMRGREAPKSARPAEVRSAAVPKPTVAAPKPTPEAAPPQGRSPRWSIDRDPEGPLRLEGQVVDPDGAPAAGVTVWLSAAPPRTTTTEDDGTFSFDRLVGRTYAVSARRGELIGGPVRAKLTAGSEPVVIRLGEGAALVVTVVDDAKQPVVGAEVKLRGSAELAVKTTERGTVRLAPVHPGWLTVTATAPGYAAGRAFTTVGSAGATGELTITLHKGQPVAGRVIDDAGKPIAGVQITASEGFGLDDGDREAAATTDAAGQFTIAALAGGTYRLRATDGEHAPATSPPITVADRPVSKIEIIMIAGGTLSGTVVDTSRKPVGFAIVRVAATGQQIWEGGARQATSDAKGAFELRGLPRTKLQARAESDAAASKLVDVDLTETARRGDLELVLDVTGTIAGIVVDDTGLPVPEVQVNAFPDIIGGASAEGLALAGMSSVTTGGGGEFVIQGVPDGAYRLWAARGSAQVSGWGAAGTSAKTGDRNVRLTLAAAGSLIGTLVLAGSGAAPALATVSIGYQPATPAPGGVFQIKELSPRSYDVTFRGPEFAELIKRDVRIEAGKVTDLGVVTVTRGRRVTGKVTDRAGAPVPGAKIKVGEMLYSSADAGDAVESFEAMAGVRSTLSDQNGAFVLVGLPATATQIIAEHAERGQSPGVAVPAGDSDLPPITLALRGFGSIAGRVTQRGKPLASAAVSATTKGGGAQGQFTTTGSDGAFLLAKVPEGTHVVSGMQRSMMSMKSASVTVQVTAGKQATANIVVAAGEITMTVQVRARPGNQVDSAQVFLFAGQVTLTTGKELLDSVLQSAVQGSTFWFGAGKPAPTFAELVAGDYSICALPITGSLNDPQFQQRLQENIAHLKVYCRAARVTAAPLAQSFDVELPAMAPFPPAP